MGSVEGMGSVESVGSVAQQPSLLSGTGHSASGKDSRQSRNAIHSRSAFISNLLEKVGHQTVPGAMMVLFENQMALAEGLRRVIKVPTSVFYDRMHPTRWGLVCPAMRAIDEADARRCRKVSTDGFWYYDGFDVYTTELEARDTRFAEALITRPNPVYDTSMPTDVFTLREVFTRDSPDAQDTLITITAEKGAAASQGVVPPDLVARKFLDDVGKATDGGGATDGAGATGGAVATNGAGAVEANDDDDGSSEANEDDGDAGGASKAAPQARTGAKMAAEKKATEKKAAAKKAAEQKAAEQKAAEQKAAEQKAAEQKAAEQKAAEQKAAEQKAAEQKAAEQKAAEQKAAEQKAAEQKAAKKAAGKKAAGKKAAGKKAAGKKAAEEVIHFEV